MPIYTKPKEEVLDVGETIRRLCPDYLAMGMTLDEYWNGDADLPKYVRKAYYLRQEKENRDMWMQGLYVYNALLCASPVYHDFVKHPRPIPYLSEPLKLHDDEPKTTVDEDMKELENQAIIRAWVERVNRMKEGKQSG